MRGLPDEIFFTEGGIYQGSDAGRMYDKAVFLMRHAQVISSIEEYVKMPVRRQRKLLEAATYDLGRNPIQKLV